MRGASCESDLSQAGAASRVAVNTVKRHCSDERNARLHSGCNPSAGLEELSRVESSHAQVWVWPPGAEGTAKTNWSEGNCLATLQRLMGRWCETRGASRRGDRPRKCPVVRSEESDGDCGSGVKLES
jgi:hypothetical protein